MGQYVAWQMDREPEAGTEMQKSAGVGRNRLPSHSSLFGWWSMKIFSWLENMKYGADLFNPALAIACII